MAKRRTNSSKVFLVGYPAQLILIASITPWNQKSIHAGHGFYQLRNVMTHEMTTILNLTPQHSCCKTLLFSKMDGFRALFGFTQRM
jgi:hypothetical protein